MSLNQLISPVKALDIVVDKINGLQYNSADKYTQLTTQDVPYVKTASGSNIDSVYIITPPTLVVGYGSTTNVLFDDNTNRYDMFSFEGSVVLETVSAPVGNQIQIQINDPNTKFSFLPSPEHLIYMTGQGVCTTQDGVVAYFSNVSNQLVISYVFSGVVPASKLIVLNFQFKFRNLVSNP